MPLEIKMGRIFEESADVLVIDKFYYPTDNERKAKILQLRQKAPYAAFYINNTTDNPLFQDICFDKDILLGMQSFANLFDTFSNILHQKSLLPFVAVSIVPHRVFTIVSLMYTDC